MNLHLYNLYYRHVKESALYKGTPHFTIIKTAHGTIVIVAKEQRLYSSTILAGNNYEEARGV
jgi:hypothetical protein